MSLIKIGESIHCTLPALRGSVLRLLSNDPLAQYAGERHIAQTIRTQVDAGADFLDVNVDELAAGGFTFEQTADAMRRLLALILKHGDGVPPGIDSADPRLLEVGLRYWYQAKGGSVAGPGNGVPARRRPPILNSVAASRLELLALRREFPFSVIAMLLEKVSADGTPFEVGFSEAAPAESYWHTARFLFQKCRAAGFTASEIFFDPTVGPLGADYVGYTKQTFGGIKLIKSDPELADSHVVLGLSNCADGLPHRGSINRAYLRVAMEHGADAAICDVTRVTGQDKVSPASLRLVKQVISPKGGDPATALEHLADYCAAQSRPTPARPVPAVRNTLAEALGTPGRVVYLAEMVPSEGQLDQLFRFAEQARRHPDVVLSLTDSAGGVRTPQPDPLAVEVARLMDRQPLVNVSCKSEDRDGLLNRLIGLYRMGLRNVFAITGDYPRAGQAVFDLDSVSLLLATWALKSGLDFPTLLPRSGGAMPDLFAGAAISPFKYNEAELWGQRLKAWKKWRAGASFFITQVGYDVKKYDELRLSMAQDGMAHVPVIGNVFVLTKQTVPAFASGKVPGAFLAPDVQDKYAGRMQTAAQKKAARGQGFSDASQAERALALRRAALLADVLVRGLGYRGIDFGGLAKFDDLAEILALKEELAQRDWRENYAEYRDADGTRELRFAPEKAFYFYPEGEDGLLRDGLVRIADRSSYQRPPAALVRAHDNWFEPGTLGAKLLGRMLEKSDREGLGRLVTFLERTIKTETLGCQMCGDCRLADLQFRCPQPLQGCYKTQLNGPCGGATVDGMCEVDAQRACYWRLVMESALATNTVEGLYRLHLPRDPQLRGSSSWRNSLFQRTVPPLAVGLPAKNGALTADTPAADTPAAREPAAV